MSARHDGHSLPGDLRHLSPPPRRQRRPMFWMPIFMLCILFFTEILGNGPLASATAFAATLQAPAKGVTTYQQFMKLAKSTPAKGTLTRQLTVPTSKAAQASTVTQKTNPAKVLPAAEPAKMKPLRVALSANSLATTQVGTPLKQLGSDQRLEVQIAPGALDVTHARLASGVAPAGIATNGLTLQITQRSGHYAGTSSVLGTYEFQLVDQQGHVVQGIIGRHPITIVYHYQLAELKALGIDPGRVILSWPDLLAAARKAKLPTTGLSVLMTNNTKTHTLTAQSTVVTAAAFALASTPTLQQPPKAHLASVQGNSGNLTYSYPMQLPPGPNGFTPQLAFNYSTAAPNGRHSPLTPADNLGDGWNLGMGSISSESYPDTSAGGTAVTRYSLSGPDGVSDMLIPDPNNVGYFYTEHISHEKILGLNMSSTTDTPSCFHVWGTSGTYYEYGCTSDSLQYITDSSDTKSTYRWDLNRIVAPRNGPNAPSKQIKISYFQDMANDVTGYDTVRDAVMAQIVYETVDPAASPTTKIVGTVDFQYRAPAVPSSVPSGTKKAWVVSYGENYNCASTPIGNTSQRCDTPTNYSSSTKAPAVMSSFSLQRITSYIGADTANDPAYGYTFNYLDTPYVQITDPITQDDEYAAGEHLLTDITPIQYIGGTAHTQKQIAFSYIPLTNTYYDSQQTANDGSTQFQQSTHWQYLNYYVELDTNIGESVDYQIAYSNTHGTPYVTDSNGVVIDDRHDPFYCTNHANDSDHSKRCTGNYAHPDDQSWSVQVVTNREALGKDSSDPNLQPATYNYTYTLGVWGTYQSDFSSSGTFCYPAKGSPLPAGQNDCVFDTYIPGPAGGNQDQDWQDFYHGEFHGFGKVYTVSTSGNLDVQTFYTPESWGTPESDAQNYQSGQMIKDDVYAGNGEVDGHLITETVNQYSGTSDFLPAGASAYSTACTDGVDDVYTPCEMVQVFSKTTTYEQNGTAITNAPWVQTTNTYDDYDTSGGLQTTGYHNLLQVQTTSSNAPTVTKKSTYAVNDSSHSSFTYYNVNLVKHSEVDDAAGHVWQCQDTKYDEGISLPATPAAGLATTTTTYSNCADQSHTALNTYTGYDSYGNIVASVDAFGAANSALYSSTGCTPAVAPVYKSAAWTATRYTTCTDYDSYQAQPVKAQNVLSQSTTTTYDYTQAAVPVSTVDNNGQTTTTSYSYDSNGDRTAVLTQPITAGAYTRESMARSSCAFASKLPCYEIDSVSALYPGAIKQTFYDAQANPIETRTPGPDAGHDTIVFTVNNELIDASFQSVGFRVPHGTGWIDPVTATDETNTAPAGTITYKDALGRTTGTKDPILGSTSEPGITCPGLTGTWTTCTTYGLGSPNGDSHTYADSVQYDANGHMSVTFTDESQQARFAQSYSQAGDITQHITTTKETRYNALNKPTTVILTDLAPQAGQTATTVTTTATYDDIGRLLTSSDPDRGNHTYAYDANGHQTTDVSGSRTLGTSYDLLGRSICVQDAAPTTNGSGNCSSGSHPLVQNTYDQSKLGTAGSTDFPVGQLTQSVATTYYSDGTSTTATEQFQHDQRMRVVKTTLQVGLPAGWNVSNALPTYQQTLQYNDANQVTTTQTMVGGQTGYTFTQAYDSTVGEISGLSNNTVGVPNLATLGYDLHGLVSDVNLQTTTGTALANNHYSYDGNLRPVNAAATWQSGSGATGNIFSVSRVYDPAGNVTSSSSAYAAVQGQSSSGGVQTQNFCYNESNQLVWAGNTGTQPSTGDCGTAQLANTLGGNGYSSSFAYTHLGQIWQGPLNGTGAQLQYLYCDSTHPHQLTGIYPLGTTCAALNGTNYASSYDQWGNVTSRTYNAITASLSYDALDHFTQWSAGSSSQEQYAYDATGDRILRRSTTSSTSMTVYAFGLEEHVYDGTGVNQSNTYYYSLHDRLIGKTDGTNTQFFLSDELGSVLTTFSALPGSASVLGNQTYGPYGNKLYSSGSTGTDKGFTGQYNDPLTGLDYYKARYYDPASGRFLTADTVQGNMQGMDPYNYVGGNPETHNDPTGHCWPVCTVIAGAVIGGLIGGGMSLASQAMSGHGVNWGEVGKQAAVGAVTGAISGLAGPEAGLLVHSAVGAAAGAAGQVVSNAIDHKAIQDGVLEAAVSNGLMAGAGEAAGPLLQKATNGLKSVAGGLMKDATSTVASACGLSFASNTPVATPTGERAIGDLQVGDQVQAYDVAMHKATIQTVQKVFINHDNDLIDVTLAIDTAAKSVTAAVVTTKQHDADVASHGSHAPPSSKETISTTEKHPWLTTNKGWIEAGALHLGDHVLRLDGTAATVVALKVVPGEQDMYDLTVSNVHTFAVGTIQSIVHNTNCNPVAKSAARSLLQRARSVIGRGNLDNVTIGAAKASDSTWLASANQRVAKSGVSDLTDTVAVQLKDIVKKQGGTYVGPTQLAPAGTLSSSLLHAEDYLLAEAPNYGGLDGIGTATLDICTTCRAKILLKYPDLLANLR